jgi:hypothetical protein
MVIVPGEPERARVSNTHLSLVCWDTLVKECGCRARFYVEEIVGRWDWQEVDCHAKK